MNLKAYYRRLIAQASRELTSKPGAVERYYYLCRMEDAQ